MAFKKNNPGCNAAGGCGCKTCTIAADDFNRADNTDIDTGSSAGWTEVSGSWAIVSNELQCTSAGIAICNTPHPDSAPQSFVTATARRTANGTASIILAYVDSTHYYEVRYTIGSGAKIQILRADGGAPEEIKSLAVTINTGTAHPIAACVDASGFITAYFSGIPRLTAYQGAPAGVQVGFAAGSGTTEFDSFTMSKSGPGCSVCEPVADCSSLCDTDSGPFLLLVEISGVTTGNGQCATCVSHHNGMFIVPFEVGSPTVCKWTSAVPFQCFVSEIRAHLYAASGIDPHTSSGDDHIMVTFFNQSQRSAPAWRLTLGSPEHPCAEWDELDIPYLDDGFGVCIASSSTCKITAL